MWQFSFQWCWLRLQLLPVHLSYPTAAVYVSILVVSYPLWLGAVTGRVQKKQGVEMVGWWWVTARLPGSTFCLVKVVVKTVVTTLHLVSALLSALLLGLCFMEYAYSSGRSLCDFKLPRNCHLVFLSPSPCRELQAAFCNSSLLRVCWRLPYLETM